MSREEAFVQVEPPFRQLTLSRCAWWLRVLLPGSHELWSKCTWSDLCQCPHLQLDPALQKTFFWISGTTLKGRVSYFYHSTSEYSYMIWLSGNLHKYISQRFWCLHLEALFCNQLWEGDKTKTVITEARS